MLKIARTGWTEYNDGEKRAKEGEEKAAVMEGNKACASDGGVLPLACSVTGTKMEH